MDYDLTKAVLLQVRVLLSVHLHVSSSAQQVSRDVISGDVGAPGSTLPGPHVATSLQLNSLPFSSHGATVFVCVHIPSHVIPSK